MILLAAIFLVLVVGVGLMRASVRTLDGPGAEPALAVIPVDDLSRPEILQRPVQSRYLG
jgi:hypothetical protein